MLKSAEEGNGQILPPHNPVYGDEIHFVPDFVIDVGNNGFFNDAGDFPLDPGNLYYSFAYCEKRPQTV